MLNLKTMDELTEFEISLYNINECKNGRVGGGLGSVIEIFGQLIVWYKLVYTWNFFPFQ